MIKKRLNDIFSMIIVTPLGKFRNFVFGEHSDKSIWVLISHLKFDILIVSCRIYNC